MRIIKAGSTSKSVYFDILDSTSTTGGRKTGLAFNTASLTAYYAKNGAASVAITLATQTASGAYSSGGFVEVDATHMPGIYRLDLPNAAISSGTSVVVTLTGATGMVTASIEIQLVAFDPQDAVRAGLTALPNAAADAAGGLAISDAGGLDLDTKLNHLDADITSRLAPTTSGRTLDVSTTGEAGIDWSNIGAPTTVVGLSGTTVKTATDVETDTQDIQTKIGTPAGVSVSADIAEIEAETDDIAAIKTVTDALPDSGALTSLATAASITALNDISAADVNAEVVDVLRTDTIPDSYAAEGAQPTIAQAVLMILQILSERTVSSTTLTIKKPDGSTSAMTFTLNDASSPTSQTRAT